MKLKKLLIDSKKIDSVEKPEAVIMVGPPGSGKTHISKDYKSTHVIIDVDKLRCPPIKEDIEDLDESYYRYTSQAKAEKRRDEVIERMILEKKNIVIHILTGSKYWYEQALNIHYSGYKVKFVFILTNKDQTKVNIFKKNKEERESQGYAIVAEDDFINYSFETIPQLLLLTLKDESQVIEKVALVNQDGVEFTEYSREDIYRALKGNYMKNSY